MVSENAFTRNDQIELESTPLSVEMAVIKEWVVRDEHSPDNLILVYVAPCEDGTIAAACACPRGAADKTCPHALAVINEIKDQLHLVRELFSKAA
jgi:hypothetical protein